MTDLAEVEETDGAAPSGEQQPISLAEAKARKKRLTATVDFALDPNLVKDLDQMQPKLGVLRIRAGYEGVEQSVKDEYVTMEEKAEALKREIRQNSITFKFQSIGRPTFEELVLEHRPDQEQVKKAQSMGEKAGWNNDTFPPALMHACLVSPDWSIKEIQELWVDEDWSTAEIRSLFETCLDLNGNRMVPDLGNG